MWFVTGLNTNVIFELEGIRKGFPTLVAGMLERPMLVPVMFSLTVWRSKFHLASRMRAHVWLINNMNGRVFFELGGVQKSLFTLVADVLRKFVAPPVVASGTRLGPVRHMTAALKYVLADTRFAVLHCLVIEIKPFVACFTDMPLFLAWDTSARFPVLIWRYSADRGVNSCFKSKSASIEAKYEVWERTSNLEH